MTVLSEWAERQPWHAEVLAAGNAGGVLKLPKWGAQMTEVGELVAPRDLDALVAEKVMGWKRTGDNDWTSPDHAAADLWDSKGPHPRLVGPDGSMWFYCECRHTRESRLPEFSTDIADTWRVAERMRGIGLRPVVMPDWGKQWQVVVYRQDQYVCQSKWSDSVELAICRAALAAVSA